MLGNPRPDEQIRELNEGTEDNPYIYEIMNRYNGQGSRQKSLDREQYYVDDYFERKGKRMPK